MRDIIYLGGVKHPEQIAVFHINDSKNPAGAQKDRHANIGCGAIGFDALCGIVHHPDFLHVPKILETPYVASRQSPKKSYPPYKYELAMLRSGIYDAGFTDQILSDAEEL